MDTIYEVITIYGHFGALLLWSNHETELYEYAIVAIVHRYNWNQYMIWLSKQLILNLHLQ